MTRSLSALLILLALAGAAHGFGLGLGNRFGKLGSFGKGGSVTPPAGCASPTAPNGQIDLSQCSNAFYVAVVLY